MRGKVTEVYGGLGRGNSRGKGHEAGMNLVYLRNSKEVDVAKAKWSRGQKLGEDVREKTDSEHEGPHRQLYRFLY